MNLRVVILAATAVVMTFTSSFSEGADTDSTTGSTGGITLPKLEPVDLKYLAEKVANITRTLKFRPFRVVIDYNRLQVPNYSYVYSLLKTGQPYNETAMSMVEASGVLQQIVNTTLKIKYITDFGDRQEEITFAADLILNWEDPAIYIATRYEFNFTWAEQQSLEHVSTDQLYKTLDSDIMGTIWKPDIFIENTVQITYPELMSKPVTIRLNELMGRVIFVARVRAKMSCEMDFHYYPADTQKCLVILRSNSYSKEELKMKWVEPFGVTLEHCEGSGFDYQVEGIDTLEEHESYLGNRTRQFSGLRFTILARRKLSYHIVQTFLPSVFFIVITWLCFFIPPQMGEARIGIAMTTLLTLTAMFASVRENSPIVTYVRAIDIWMLSCVSFVFLTLLEFTTSLWISHRKAKFEEADKDSMLHCAVLVKQNNDHDDESLESKFCCRENNKKRRKEFCSCSLSECIEKYSVVLYPFIFIIFLSLYWGWLITRSGYIAWKVDRNFNCASD